jgi:hypothetical protein
MHRYGVIIGGLYLKLNGTTAQYPHYPFETIEAAEARAISANLQGWKWKIVDDHDFAVKKCVNSSQEAKDQLIAAVKNINLSRDYLIMAIRAASAWVEHGPPDESLRQELLQAEKVLKELTDG